MLSHQTEIGAVSSHSFYNFVHTCVKETYVILIFFKKFGFCFFWGFFLLLLFNEVLTIRVV